MRVRLELWSKDQGGRHSPVFDGYRPDFRASTEGHGDVDLEGDQQVGTATVLPA